MLECVYPKDKDDNEIIPGAGRKKYTKKERKKEKKERKKERKKKKEKKRKKERKKYIKEEKRLKVLFNYIPTQHSNYLNGVIVTNKVHTNGCTQVNS